MSLRLISLLIPSRVGRLDTYPFRSIAQAAQAAGREVLLLGSSMKRVVNVARDLGLMEGIQPFIAEDEFSYIPRDRIVVILTGSQGEPRAALAKISRDEMQIGRASCRERVCQFGEITVVAVSLKKKHKAKQD